MNSHKRDDLIDKYLAAESTLEEEEKLIKGAHQGGDMAEWFAYAKKQQKKAPADLENSIWAAIQARKRKKQRYLVSLYGMAASIALIMAFFIYQKDHKNDRNDQHAALLQEAMSMFSNEKQVQPEKNIIYEDDQIIIYLTSN